MEIIKFRTAVLLICGILYLIKDVYLLECLRYMKYEAICDGLLNSWALCRAKSIEYNEYICINGFKSCGYYYAISSCKYLFITVTGIVYQVNKIESNT